MSSSTPLSSPIKKRKSKEKKAISNSKKRAHKESKRAKESLVYVVVLADRLSERGLYTFPQDEFNPDWIEVISNYGERLEDLQNLMNDEWESYRSVYETFLEFNRGDEMYFCCNFV
jgi:hypothetical protein